MWNDIQKLKAESAVIADSVNELSDFIDGPEFLKLPNNMQLLLMEKYDLSCAYTLLLSDLLKLLNPEKC